MDNRRNNFDQNTSKEDDIRPLISALLAIIGIGAILIFATLFVLTTPVSDRSASLLNTTTQSQLK